MVQVIEDFEYVVVNFDFVLSLEVILDVVNGFLVCIVLYQGCWVDVYNLVISVLGVGFDLILFVFLVDQVFLLCFIFIDGNFFGFFYGIVELGGCYLIEFFVILMNVYEVGDVCVVVIFVMDGIGIFYGLKYSDFVVVNNGQGIDLVMFICYVELVLIVVEVVVCQNNFMDVNVWYSQVCVCVGLVVIILDVGNFEDLILEECFLELVMEGGYCLWDLCCIGCVEVVFGLLGYDVCDVVWGLFQCDIDCNFNLNQNGCCNC